MKVNYYILCFVYSISVTLCYYVHTVLCSTGPQEERKNYCRRHIKPAWKNSFPFWKTILKCARWFGLLMGVYNTIFDLQFFSLFEPIWAPDTQSKVFSNSNSVLISSRYSITRLSPRRRSLQCVTYRRDHLSLSCVQHTAQRWSPWCATYCTEMISVVCNIQYPGDKLHTAESKSKSSFVYGFF